MPSERFMQKHYGPSGFVDRAKYGEDVDEKYRLAAVIFCKERELDYTLGTMLQMARFAQQCCEADPATERKEPDATT